MARNKYPEVTRKRIIESAVKLFTVNGWDNVTIQEIVDDVGDITRGAFYHHFKTRADVIDAITKEMLTANNYFNDISDLKNLNALERLRQGISYSISQSVKEEDLSTIPFKMNSAEFVYSRITEGVQVVAPGIQKKLLMRAIETAHCKLLFPSKQLKPLQCFLIFG